MFDSKQTLTNRLADAVDLAIDFATLGEYGLEPVQSAPRVCETRDAHLRSVYSLRCRETSCLTSEFKQLRGSGRNAARRRGDRGASSAFTADGAA
jgi:hypothetical protein